MDDGGRDLKTCPIVLGSCPANTEIFKDISGVRLDWNNSTTESVSVHLLHLSQALGASFAEQALIGGTAYAVKPFYTWHTCSAWLPQLTVEA